MSFMDAITNNLKNGFSGADITVGEVLITLGVIGVVAAMTMPTLIKKYQQHVAVTQLKKAYTELNQAIKFSEAEYGGNKVSRNFLINIFYII